MTPAAHSSRTGSSSTGSSGDGSSGDSSTGDGSSGDSSPGDDRKATAAEFGAAVNMTAKELEHWLTTDESKSVGQKDGGDGESVGHESGRRIVELLHRKKSDWSDDDYAHMHKVIGYVHRHLAQRPSGDVTDTRWRYSLMNWGHDPLK